jgi:hypothetical protein
MSSSEGDQFTLENGQMLLARRDYQRAAQVYHAIALQQNRCFEAWHGCMKAITMNCAYHDHEWIYFTREINAFKVAEQCVVLSPEDRIQDVYALIEMYIMYIHKNISLFEPTRFQGTAVNVMVRLMYIIAAFSTAASIYQIYNMYSLLLWAGTLILAITMWVCIYRRKKNNVESSRPYPAHYQSLILQCVATENEMKSLMKRKMK